MNWQSSYGIKKKRNKFLKEVRQGIHGISIRGALP